MPQSNTIPVSPSCDAAAPLGHDEFSALIEAVGPFEHRPRVAVALSGGPDSLAMTLLLERWVRDRRGTLDALTVDHGLRPESAAEAESVGSMLDRTSVRHHVLRWPEPKPRSGIQQSAREARYRLMLGWCTRAMVLHLFVAHHLEDQAETMLMRLARGSGRSGLAAMSPVVEHRQVRVLRPCLSVPRDRLRGSLQGSGLTPVQDPSNEDRGYARVRVRSRLPSLAEHGLGSERLGRTAAEAGRFRRVLEGRVAASLAAVAQPRPAGYSILRAEPFAALSLDLQVAVLERVLCATGRALRPPRTASVLRLAAALRRCVPVRLPRFAGATLGGCRVLGHRGDILVVREAAAAHERVEIRGWGSFWWDGRFDVRVGPGRGEAAMLAAEMRCLGLEGWKEIVQLDPRLREHPIPSPARESLPAIWDAEGVLEVPHLAYRRVGAALDTVRVEGIRFRPVRPMAGAGFMVA